MRILVDYRPALRERTGVGEYIHQLAAALVATAPSDEHIVLFSSSWKDRLSAGAVPGADILDRQVPVRLLNLLWHRLEWPPVEWLGAGRLDVCHSAHPLLMPTERAAQVVMVHDLDFLDHPERTRAEIRRDYPALAARHVARADRVIVVSANTAADVETRLGVPRSQMTVCPPGTPGWARRQNEPTDGYLLFLGTLEPRKNIGVLLDAYERLIARWPAAPRLVLAGRAGPDATAIVLRAQAAPLAGRVELAGYIHPDRRLEVYSRALAFVLPSHTEGFGLPAIEAMMVGVPVIAADRGALRESVGAAGRLFDPTAPDELAQALYEVLTDPARRQAMSDRGRRHAEQFTWVNTARHTREAWQLAIEHRRARRG